VVQCALLVDASMQLPVKDQLELVAKAVGIGAPAFAALKGLIIYALDHSMDRKSSKIVEEIDAYLTRLTKLESEKAILQTPEVEQYKLQVMEDLQIKLRTLDSIRARKRRRELERNEEPTGFRKWLLLYRPEGFDGWIIHSLFYTFVFVTVSLIVEASVFALLEHNATMLILLPISLLYVGLALYFRGISLRMKSAGNVVRLRSIQNPNSDLSWIRRTLLIFKKGDRGWGLRLLYYLFRIEGLVVLAYPRFLNSPPGESPPGRWVGLAMVIAAQFFRIDALSRRAQRRLSSSDIGSISAPSGEKLEAR
jgi:hypothetical protein